MTEPYQQIADECRDYIDTRLEIFRFRTIERAATIMGLILRAIAVGILILGILIFVCGAIVHALDLVLPEWATYLIMAGMLGLLILVLHLCTRTLFIHPMQRMLTRTFTEAHETLSDRELSDRINELEKEQLQQQLELQLRVSTIRESFNIAQSVCRAIYRGFTSFRRKEKE